MVKTKTKHPCCRCFVYCFNKGKVYQSKVSYMSTSTHTQLTFQQDLITASRIGDVKWLESTLRKVNEDEAVLLEVFNDKGLSCFHVTALECKIESIKFLLENITFDVNLPTKYGGWTALHLCMNNVNTKGSFECLKCLVENGGNCEATTDTGLTPLHLASSLGLLNHVEYLLQRSIEAVDVLDSFGQTPYTLAMLWGHREVGRVLAHQMWLKEKAREAAANTAVDKFMQSLNHDLKAPEEKLKIERQLKSEKCYKEWYQKNKFVYNPLLLGPLSKEERAEITDNFLKKTSLISESISQQSRKLIKSNDGETRQKKKQGASKSQQSRRNDRHVDFIPLNDCYK